MKSALWTQHQLSLGERIQRKRRAYTKREIEGTAAAAAPRRCYCGENLSLHCATDLDACEHRAFLPVKISISLASGNVEKGAHLVGRARDSAAVRVAAGAFLRVEVCDQPCGQVLEGQAAGHAARLPHRPATWTTLLHSA